MESVYRETARVVRTAATLLRKARSEAAFRDLCTNDLAAALADIGLADQVATYTYAADFASGEQQLVAELPGRTLRFTMSPDGDYRFENAEREAAEQELQDADLAAVAGGYVTQTDFERATDCCWNSRTIFPTYCNPQEGACAKGESTCRSTYFGGAFPNGEMPCGSLMG